MPAQNERLSELFNLWYNHKASEMEEAELMDLLKEADQAGELEGLMQEAYSTLQSSSFFTVAQKDTIANNILDKRQAQLFTFRKVAVAASIVIALGLGSYLLFFNNKGKQTEIVKTNLPAKDVEAPKFTKAMIQLADGRTVALDSLTSLSQGNVKINKTNDGQVVYHGSSLVVEYNTFINPRGSKVQPLTLSDGTKVWLNSESSLRYPIAFIGIERKVEITGEAYFEVTKDTSKKFMVTGNGVTTEVLDTHFNVNTYADETSIKITLLEGSVKVTKGNSSGILKPGQQAQVGNDVTIINGADLEAVMAWKNGRFELNGQTIEPIMRQIARWYDVEVEYRGIKPTANFMGGTSRQDNLSELLKILEQTKAVKFNIEGKKVIVTH